jgi:hypothetical protein
VFIANEFSPYDKLPLTVTLPANDPLYKVKRGILQVGGGCAQLHQVPCVQFHD